MNKLSQVQSQKLSQKLELRPKMLESLQMLAMPLMQLEVHLKNELVSNPLLELQDDYEETEEKEKEKEKKETETEKEEEPEVSEIQETIEEAKELSEILDNWNEYHTTEKSGGQGQEDDETSPDKYVRQPENLKQYFLEAIYAQINDEDSQDFASELLDATDPHGFIGKEYNYYELGLSFGLDQEQSDAIRNIILNTKPKGITARSIEECLIAQVEEEQIHARLIKAIIAEDFSNLIHRRYVLLAGKYQVSQDTIFACKEEISKLDPKPGLRILSEDIAYIVPDVIIKEIDEEYEVIVNDFNIPNISLSKRYSKILKDVKKDKNALTYVRNKISSAKFLIKSMYMRNRTLERVTKAIISHQRSFFYLSSGVLEPLTYAVIAAELQVNESTISRVVRKKYADTPFGVMCLKDFFTSTAGKDRNYEAVSRQRVQVIIQKLIDNEDKKKPLSDQELMKILKERGISVSRRVIAKYREGLGILNSRLRRKS